MELTPGSRSSVEIVVAQADTAAVVGSGDVPVLATPRLLALAEAAAVAAIAPMLRQGLTSVGTHAMIEHMRASPVGARVVVVTELTNADGRGLEFTFSARQVPHDAPTDQGGEVVGAGTMKRIVVDRERFISRAQPAVS